MPGLKLAPKSDQSDYQIETPTIGDYDVAFGIQNPGLGRRVRPTTDNLVTLISGASNGETFILEPGTHVISAPIAFGASLFNISIIGTRGAIIKGTGASIANMMEIGALNNGLRLEGFTFEVRTGDGNAIKVIGGTDEVVIKDIMFIKEGTTLTGNCIEFALGAGVNASKWTIEGCFASQGVVANNWANFITTDATTSALSLFKVLNNTITSTGVLAGSSGIRFLTTGGLSRSIIQGNTCENLDVVGVEITAGSKNTISINIIRLGINLGLDIKAGFSIIENNIIDNASSIAIAIEGNNVTCNANWTEDCGTAIVLTSGAQRAIISNNIILGGVTHDGIELRTGVSNEHRIIGNIISGTLRGIELQDGEDVVIADNSILNIATGASPGGVGIWLSATAVRRVQIRNNYMEPNKEGILDASDNGFHTFQDNEIRGGTIGISVISGLDGDGIVIKGNKLITQTNAAMTIFFDADGPIVTENIIRGSTFAGVIMLFKRNTTAGVTKLQVNDNHIVSCTSATVCIQVDDSDGAQINDNRVANNGGDGIRIANSDDSSVSHNHITDQTGDGIHETATCTGNRYKGNFFKTITGIELNLLGTGRVTSTRTITGSFDITALSGDADKNIIAEKDINKVNRAYFWISQNGFDLGANTDQPVKLTFFSRDTFTNVIDDGDPNTGGIVAELTEFHHVVQDLETAITAGVPDVNIDDTALYSAGLLVRVVDATELEFQRIKSIDDATDMTMEENLANSYALNDDVALVQEVPGFAYRDLDESGEFHLRISPGDTGGDDFRLNFLIEYEIDN